MRAVAAGKVTSLYRWPDEVLQQQPYLTGENITIGDVYVYVTLRWAKALGLDLSAYSALDGFMKRVEADQGVQAALSKQGLL